jgi:hypothetical protein
MTGALSAVFAAFLIFPTFVVLPATAGSAALEDSPQAPFGPHACKQGFVWREAFAGDLVCVSPGVRGATIAENAMGPSYRQPGGGDACKQGYEWRAARPSDHVCVPIGPPYSRGRARVDNGSAVIRLANPWQIARGGVHVTTHFETALFATGNGLTPNGQVSFWSAASGLPTSYLGTLKADFLGTLPPRWKRFYSNINCRFSVRKVTVIVLDQASGTVTTGGTTTVHPRCIRVIGSGSP